MRCCAIFWQCCFFPVEITSSFTTRNAATFAFNSPAAHTGAWTGVRDPQGCFFRAVTVPIRPTLPTEGSMTVHVGKDKKKVSMWTYTRREPATAQQHHTLGNSAPGLRWRTAGGRGRALIIFTSSVVFTRIYEKNFHQFYPNTVPSYGTHIQILP